MNNKNDPKFIDEDDHDFLNKVDRELYRRDRKPFADVRIKLSKTSSENFSWQNPNLESNKNIFSVSKDTIQNVKKQSKTGFSFFSFGLLIFSIILFIFSAIYAGYIFYTGQTSLKHADILVDLNIPSFTNSGQSLSSELIIKNNNKVGFTQSFVSIDVKNNENNTNQNLFQVEVGDVLPAKEFRKNLDIILQGKEGENKEVIITLYYKITGTGSTFQKEIKKQIKIQKSQAIINISGPKAMSIGQVAEYRISARAGSEDLNNIGLFLDLPKDMKILSSSIDPVSKNIYNLGSLKQGEEKVLSIKTIFEDKKELADTFSLKASVGSLLENNLNNIFADTVVPISLKSTPFSITIESEKQNGNTIYFSEERPKVKVTITNDSNDYIRNGVFLLKLSGGLLNPKAVVTGNAVYDAGTGMAKATAETLPALKEIAPQKSVSFEIQIQNTTQTTINSSRRILFDATFSADIPDTAISPATVKKTTALLPKDTTLATLKTYYFSGPFKNTGNMPPAIGSKTTYTLIAGVETYGGFTDGVYTITLPSYVEYIQSDSKNVTYNKSNRQIIWKIGEIKTQDTTFININKREIAVQVSIIPSPDQLKQSPRLTNKAEFTAVSVDKSSLSSSIADVDINFYKDPKYEFSKGYGSVIE